MSTAKKTAGTAAKKPAAKKPAAKKPASRKPAAPVATKKMEPATKHKPPMNQPMFCTKNGTSQALQPDIAFKAVSSSEGSAGCQAE